MHTTHSRPSVVKHTLDRLEGMWATHSCGRFKTSEHHTHHKMGLAPAAAEMASAWDAEALRRLEHTTSMANGTSLMEQWQHALLQHGQTAVGVLALVVAAPCTLVLFLVLELA